MLAFRAFRRLSLAAISVTLATASGAATLQMEITLNGEPLLDPLHGKFYVYELEKRDHYLAWGHSEKPVRIKDGAYDIVVKYDRDHLHAERQLQAVKLAGEVTRRIDFGLNPATLTLAVTNGGRPISRYSGGFSIHKVGQRGEPIASKRPGDTLVIEAGRYDVEVTYRDISGLQSEWLLDYDLTGNRLESVEIGTAVARLRLIVNAGGVPVERARYRVFRAGARENPVAEAASGAPVTVEAGVYDVALYRGFRSRAERWITGLTLQGEMEQEVELSAATASVRVDCLTRGLVDRDAWFGLHPAGDPRAEVASARSGSQVEVPPGDYDFRCYSREGGIRPEGWLYAQRIDDRHELQIALSEERAVLSVLPSPADEAAGAGVTPRLLLLLDSSFEMRERRSGASRLDQAARAIGGMLDWGRDMGVLVGLRAFGITPQAQQDCKDSALLVPPGPMGGSRIGKTVELLRPSGLAPLAHSLEQVETDLPSGQAAHVVLITASAEGCGGAPCEVAKRLIRSGRIERIEVIALDVSRAVENDLQCIGTFHEARSRRELTGMLRELLRSLEERPTGTFHLFTPGWQEWIGSAPLGRKLEVAAGRYDVMIHSGGRVHTWEAFDLHGAVEAVAGERPER